MVIADFEKTLISVIHSDSLFTEPNVVLIEGAEEMRIQPACNY